MYHKCFYLLGVTCLAFAMASDGSVHGQVANSSPFSQQRRFQEIKQDLRAFSKHAQQATAVEQHAQAVFDLCVLYCEIRLDPRFATSSTLQGYANRINYRLNHTRQQLMRASRKRQARSGRDAEARRRAGDRPGDRKFSDGQLAELAIPHLSLLMNHSTGGPAWVIDSTNGRFGGILQANADDLISLIEDILHPDTWATNGGPGTIRYWSPGMVLVVRATTEVHEDLERFLNMLKYSY